LLRATIQTKRGSLEEVQAAMRCVAQGCRELKELDLDTSYSIGDTTLQAFLRNCRRLTVLRMNSANTVSEEHMTVLGRDFPALRELCVESCSIVTRHVASWPLLEVLGVEYLSDNVVRKLVAHCPRLRVLIAERCQLVTDAGIVTLAQGCPLLRTVNFRGNTDLTVAAVNAITSCRLFESLVFAGHCMRDRVTPAEVAHFRGKGDIVDIASNYYMHTRPRAFVLAVR
jgi:hypothetical protein